MIRIPVADSRICNNFFKRMRGSNSTKDWWPFEIHQLLLKEHPHIKLKLDPQGNWELVFESQEDYVSFCLIYSIDTNV